MNENKEEMNRTPGEMRKETTEQLRMDKEDDIKTLDETYHDRPLNSFVATDRQEDYVVAQLRVSPAGVKELRDDRGVPPIHEALAWVAQKTSGWTRGLDEIRNAKSSEKKRLRL